MSIKRALRLIQKFAEQVYNCRHCGKEHRAVDPSGFMCGSCGTITYSNRMKKKEIIEPVIEEEIDEPEEDDEIEEEKPREHRELPNHNHGYPIIYYDKKNGDVLCNKCAGDEPEENILSDAYWEGPVQYCAVCGAEIESAYGDPDA